MDTHTEASLSSSSSESKISASQNTDATDRESGNLGCSHYRRSCKIRAPCCDEIFDCRHCHNEAKNSLESGTLDSHDIPRHQVQKVICSLCDTEQDVQQYCINCGVCFGKYFCSICKFFDDDVSKNQYHCDECGICRTGGKENFFHCKTCGCCYSILMKDGHRCIERAMHHSCPVCFEFLFDTTKDISVLPCGHTIHLECAKEMESHLQYSCPVCSKSICDMSRLWEKLEKVIASTPMPDTYKNKKVWILCNDCGAEGEVQFHVVAHKCLDCKSYNTKQTRGRRPTASCSSTAVPDKQSNQPKRSLSWSSANLRAPQAEEEWWFFSFYTQRDIQNHQGPTNKLSPSIEFDEDLIKSKILAGTSFFNLAKR